MVDFPSGVADTTPTFLVGGDSGASSPAKAACTTAGLAMLNAATAAVQSNLVQLVPTAVKTTTYTAAVGDYIPCDTTAAGFTVTLPTAPADKTTIAIKLVIQVGTNAVTVAAGGSDVFNKAGGSTTASLQFVNQAMAFQYSSGPAIWYIENNPVVGSIASQSAAAVAITGGAIDGTTVGVTTAAAAKFTTVAASSQITSTVTTGTAPLVVASTTNVANLNASSLAGATFAAPGPVGSGTPSTGAFTTLTNSGATTHTATTDSTSTATGGVVCSGGLGIAKNLNIGGSFSGPIHSVADTTYTITSSDHYVFMTSITASRTLTLPAANTVPAGFRVNVGDLSGSVTLAINIVVAPNGTDTINGVNGTVSIKAAYGQRQFVSDGATKWVFDGGVARTSGFTMTGAIAPSVFALTDAATIAVDASQGNVFTVTLGGSRTIANPTNPVNGQTITYILTQDGTGSRVVTWDTQYRFSVSQPQPVLSTTAAKIDRVAFTYNGANTKWDVSGYSLGMT